MPSWPQSSRTVISSSERRRWKRWKSALASVCVFVGYFATFFIARGRGRPRQVVQWSGSSAMAARHPAELGAVRILRLFSAYARLAGCAFARCAPGAGRARQSALSAAVVMPSSSLLLRMGAASQTSTISIQSSRSSRSARSAAASALSSGAFEGATVLHADRNAPRPSAQI